MKCSINLCDAKCWNFGHILMFERGKRFPECLDFCSSIRRLWQRFTYRRVGRQQQRPATPGIVDDEISLSSHKAHKPILVPRSMYRRRYSPVFSHHPHPSIIWWKLERKLNCGGRAESSRKTSLRSSSTFWRLYAASLSQSVSIHSIPLQSHTCAENSNFPPHIRNRRHFHRDGWYRIGLCRAAVHTDTEGTRGQFGLNSPRGLFTWQRPTKSPEIIRPSSSRRSSVVVRGKQQSADQRMNYTRVYISAIVVNKPYISDHWTAFTVVLMARLYFKSPCYRRRGWQ